MTGATGFVGAHLVRRLVHDGHAVAILRREESDCWRIRDLLPMVTQVVGSLDCPGRFRAPLDDFAPDTVAHLAWSGVGSRHRNDPSQVTDNLPVIPALLRCASGAGARQWIALGSQAEYGPWETPITEQTPARPTTLYGAAKLCASMLTRKVCRETGMRYVWLRLFAVYGPMDDPEWLIPSVILTLLRGGRPSLTRGVQRWNYLYVSDVVNAVSGMIDAADVDGVLNVASGDAVSVRAIVEQIRDLIDPSLPLGFGEVPYRADQIMTMCAETSRMRQTIGWVPRVTLADGLARTVAWYREHRQRYDD